MLLSAIDDVGAAFATDAASGGHVIQWYKVTFTYDELHNSDASVSQPASYTGLFWQVYNSTLIGDTGYFAGWYSGASVCCIERYKCSRISNEKKNWYSTIKYNTVQNLLHTVSENRETLYYCPYRCAGKSWKCIVCRNICAIIMSHDVMTCMSHQFFPSQNVAPFIAVGFSITVGKSVWRWICMKVNHQWAYY